MSRHVPATTSPTLTGASITRRVAQLVIGIVISAVGISATVRARLGVGPWDVLHQGIARHTGIAFGQVGILVGLALLLLWIPLHQRVGVGTILNVVMIGALIDLLLDHWSGTDTLATRWALLVGGIVVSGIGFGTYLGANLGAGPRDGIMTAIAQRGLSIRLARTTLELSALGLGWLLGGNVGVGTVLFAVGVGPVIQATLHRTRVAPERAD